MSRPPLPPFTFETANEKVRLAEDGWNSRNPALVAQAYTLGQFMEKSRAVSPGSESDRSIPHGQMET